MQGDWAKKHGKTPSLKEKQVMQGHMGEKLERTPNLEGASLAATTTCCKIVTG
jgi:hypothetical protein